jgi:hypothetical protein
VHGSEDSLVPLTHKDAPLNGSLDIHNKADELYIPNTLKIYQVIHMSCKNILTRFLKALKLKPAGWKPPSLPPIIYMG